MSPDTREPDADTRPPRATRRHLLQASALALGASVGARGGLAFAQDATPAAATPMAEPEPEPVVRFAVSPQHGTRTASPRTTIAFRGLSPSQLGEIRVEGSVSGGHSGIVVEHPDRNGSSWIPDDWFEPGEYVHVHADTPLSDDENGRLSFRISTPSRRITADAEPVEPEPIEVDDRFHTYVSRPDLNPPKMSITTAPNGTAPGHIFLTPSTPDGTTGRMIIDEWGEPIWYDSPRQRTFGNYCLEVGEYRGQPVLAWWEGAKTIGYGFGHWVIANSAYETIAHVQVGNGLSGMDVHEILLTPRGTAYSLIYNPIEWNLSTMGGDYRGSTLDSVVQEVDIETGLVLWEWHSLDHVRVTESYQPFPQNPEVPWDYFHVNALSIDDDGHLLLTARHTHGSYKVHSMTGEVIWRLNGRASDFEMGPDTFFAYQHDTQRQPDGTISIFDNADNQDGVTGTEQSRAIFLRLDEEAMTATLEREIIHETGILSVSQGNVQLLPNGNHLIGWGSAPVFTEYGPDNEMLYNARFPQGLQSYRAYRHEWTGIPAAPPDVVVERATTGEATVYVSWNGATEVSEWRVRGGATPDDLEELATEPRAGFETAIGLSGSVDWVVVEALDASGYVLGRSEPVRAS